MTLLSSTLADELAAIELSNEEAEAIEAWAEAYTAYFSSATANVPVVTTALEASKVAMKGAMTGFSVAGAASLQAGLGAFWAGLVPNLAFPGSTAIAPPAALSSLPTNLAPAFVQNVATSASKEDAAAAVAEVIHVSSSGGSVTIPGSPPTQVTIT